MFVVYDAAAAAAAMRWFSWYTSRQSPPRCSVRNSVYNYYSISIRRPFDYLSRVIKVILTNASPAADPLAAVYLFGRSAAARTQVGLLS